MPSAADRLDFAPPRDAGEVRAFALALLVHALLIAALTWGVSWKHTDRSMAFEAELWSSVPEQAAPRLVEPPPPPPPEPSPKTAEVKVSPQPADVDMALEQEKKRKQVQKQKEADAQKLLDKQKAEALVKKQKELKAPQEQARLKAAEEAKKLAAKQEASEKQAQAATQKQRQEAINRMMGLAGATGGANATGSAQKSSGPSASYGGKIRAKVKPNIVFTDDISGNASAEVEVRSAPDGSILSQRLIKSSGNKAWDEAVLKAIIRTETMPRDTDGRVPSPMIIEFRPKD